MATADNAQLRRFNSRFHEVGAEAVDCFAHDWAGENNWVVPGFNDVLRALAHLQTCKAYGVVVLPEWKHMPWWPLVGDNSQQSPVRAMAVLGEAAAVLEPGPAGPSLNGRTLRFRMLK
jgi:hypothetical protein